MINGLTAGATYTYYVWADCNNDGLITTEVPAQFDFCVPFATPCIDFTDLHAPQITCTTGLTNNYNKLYIYVPLWIILGTMNAAKSHFDKENSARAYVTAAIIAFLVDYLIRNLNKRKANQN